jgi:hypothetical protein
VDAQVAMRIILWITRQSVNYITRISDFACSVRGRLPAKAERSANTAIRLPSRCAVFGANVKKISEGLDKRLKYGRTDIREDYHGLLPPPGWSAF